MTYVMLLQPQKRMGFLHQIYTGDEISPVILEILSCNAPKVKLAMRRRYNNRNMPKGTQSKFSACQDMSPNVCLFRSMIYYLSLPVFRGYRNTTGLILRQSPRPKLSTIVEDFIRKYGYFKILTDGGCPPKRRKLENLHGRSELLNYHISICIDYLSRINQTSIDN